MTTTAKRPAAKPAARKPVAKPKAAPKKLDRFHQVLKRILLYEGGRVDHPKDPGGRASLAGCA